MRNRLHLFPWNILFIYQYTITWCKVTENSTSPDGNTNYENLSTVIVKNNDVNITSVDNLRYKIYINNTAYLDDLGSDMLDTLPIEFPIAFQEHEDVNVTLEQDFLAELLTKHNDFAESDGMGGKNENEINISSNNGSSELKLSAHTIAQFAKYIEKSGKRGLKTLAYKVKNLVKPTLYLNNILKVPKYQTVLEKYMTFILQKEIKCEIDEQFIILDMLETSVDIFGKASEEISGVIVQEGNITLTLSQIDTIEEAIWLAVLNERKGAFNYICKATFVCRHYPTYSDYVVKLLESILRLKKEKIQIIVDIIEDTIQVRADFLESIMGDKIANNIALEFESIADDPLKVSSLMNDAIRSISKRYKVYYIHGVELRNSTKALRILLDIIDITFHVYNGDIMGADFRDLRKTINDWGRGKKRDIERVLSDFFQNAIDFLNIYWNSEIKEEVKVLIEIMITETSANSTLRDKLFTKGSKLATADHTIYDEGKESNNMV